MLKPAPSGQNLPAQNLSGEIAPVETLADLREEIDRIDTAMHRLLMERGEIIDRLIRVKAQQGGGSAFRPGREADMMRRLVESHAGLLPVDTVETIWRIIISTFTFVQANYAVHADISSGDAAMRDCCRFHFGFTVPFETHPDIRTVIEAVKASRGDLGLVRVEAGLSEAGLSETRLSETDLAAGPWWTLLAEPGTPKIIARLPFVERSNHPAGLPLFVVATPLAEAAALDVIIFSASIDQWDESLPARLSEQNVEILDKHMPGGPIALMLAATQRGTPGQAAKSPEHLQKTLQDLGLKGIFEIGSHAARFDLALSRCEAAQ